MFNISFTPIPSSSSDIKCFQDALDAPTSDKQHVGRFIQENFDFAYQNLTILHAAYDPEKQTYIGFASLRVDVKIEGLPGLYVELIYLKPEYRNTLNPQTDQKYSFDLLDHVFSIGNILQKNSAVNHIFLVPVTDKVRETYRAYGFEDLPSSGPNVFEDYMVLNLIDEDASIE